VNAKLEPNKFDRPLLPIVVVIILIGIGELVRGWHNAHTSVQRRHPAATQVQAPPEADAITAEAKPSTQPSNEQ
jgi:hypothetical protein